MSKVASDSWLRRSVVPVYSAIVASEAVPDDVMPTPASLYETGAITVYFRKNRDNRLLMGGRGVQRDVSGPEALSYLSDYARTLWPALRGVRWTHGWNGQLAITPDHYPHIHAPDESVLVCLGYNGRGVAPGTAMGPELARRIVDPRDPAFAMPVKSRAEIRAMPWVRMDHFSPWPPSELVGGYEHSVMAGVLRRTPRSVRQAR